MISQTHELSGFQRDLMVLLSEYAEENGEKPSGAEIQELIDDRYSTDVSHARVYTNLDTLVKEGLVQKGELDLRTNYYIPTSEGEEALESYREFVGE